MKESKQTGYIAGIISTIFAIVLILVGVNIGWNLSGQIIGIFGIVFGLLAGGSFWKPESIGKITMQILRNMAENAESRSQSMDNSPNSIQQQSNRDSIINNITKEADLIIKKIDESSRGDRNKIREEEALREVYKKMIKALKAINVSANIGIKDKKDFQRLGKIIEEFIESKMEHEIDLSQNMTKVFNEVMGTFRYTLHELDINVRNSNFNQGVRGLKSFEFIKKCNEATSTVKIELGKEESL